MASEDLQRYTAQYASIQAVCQQYEEDPSNFKRLVELIQQVWIRDCMFLHKDAAWDCHCNLEICHNCFRRLPQHHLQTCKVILRIPDC
jgi:hypothetical protein